LTFGFERAGLSPDVPGTPHGGAHAGARSHPTEAAGTPILVVDDDPEILAMLRDFLEGEGFAIRTATNGAEALQALDQVAPALILLDMRMPVLDGWGFAARLRERQQAYPIIVMTAAQSAQRWAEEIGANGFIAKPFDVDELLQTIERHRRRNGRPN